MESFAALNNGQKPSTVITQLSILYLCGSPDYVCGVPLLFCLPNPTANGLVAYQNTTYLFWILQINFAQDLPEFDLKIEREVP